MKILSLGIDVSLSRGLELVLMNENFQIEDIRNADLKRLTQAIEELKPTIIAIDSPPKFGIEGNSRSAERELNRRGIKIFYTPSDSVKCRRPFYAWMEMGHKCFNLASECGFEIFYGTGPMERRTIEVFPHASAVVLSGSRPPRGWQKKKSDKRQWRLRPLKALGIDTGKLATVDQVDAALAALTGVYALKQRFASVGHPAEGVIVLPTDRLLDNYPRSR
jgi:predicted nuclease with RNAse H fold